MSGSRVLASLLIAVLAGPAIAGPKDPATKKQLARHARLAREANDAWTAWGKETIDGANDWRRSTGLPSDLFTDIQKVPSQVITQEQIEIAEETQKAIEIIKPKKIGTFWESANPMVKTKNGVHHWDELGLSGLKDPDNIKQILDKAKAEGLTDVRVGIDLNEFDPNKPETLDAFIKNTLRPMWDRGMLPIVVLDWFGNLSMLETKDANGKVILEKSYLNHPNYVEHREKIADVASKRIFSAMNPQDRIMWNSINETHTNVAFNFNGWNGSGRSAAAHGAWADRTPLTWGDPQLQRYYIPSLINVGRANVRMRAAIEKNRGTRTVLHIHNEAMTPEYYPTHEKYLQFAVSKLVMGDSLFTEADYDALAKEPLESMKQRLDGGGQLNELDGMLKLFIFGQWNDTARKRESARRKLVSMLKKYRNDNVELKQKHAVTMKHRTIFMADYYAQSEFVMPKPMPSMIDEMSKNQGEELKRVLDVRSDQDFLTMVRDAATRAEARLPGVQIWQGETSRSQIDWKRLLSAEDAIVMDLLLGFRYAGWRLLDRGPEIAARQQRLGLDKSMDVFMKAKGDEYRSDEFLADLLKNGEQKLRSALDVKTDVELRTALDLAAKDVRDGAPALQISANESIREILNKDSRRILMRLFGIYNERYIGFLPPHFPIQIRAGMREGLLPIFMRYAKTMGVLHVGIGESGTPYYPWAERVHIQMALSAAMGAKLGNYIFVAYHFGPMVHTIGWSPSPLWGDLKTNNTVNESGFFKFTDKGGGKFDYSLVNWPGKEPWLRLFTDPVFKAFAKAEANSPKVTIATSLGVVAKSRVSSKTCQALFGSR